MSHAQLYTDLQSSESSGQAVPRPSPPDDLPPSIRKFGTIPCDICFPHKDGSLDRLLNVGRSEWDALNSKGVPRDFVQFVVTNDDIRTQLLCLDKGSVILKAAVRKRKTNTRLEGGGAATVVGAAAGCEAHIDVKQAAKLALPNGASSYDFRATGRMYRYAKKNSRKLLKFAEELGYEIGNEGLLVVTGVTKASAWSITVTDNSAGGGTVSLELNAAQLGGVGVLHAWDKENSSSLTYSGPPPGEDSWENQTIFVRGFRIVPSPLGPLGAPKVLALGTK
ncbi:hypothetical protein B0H16DRAFT_1510493 [Mycena metata]|uniref:Uncharacterized protein n=1 Tax=Mycena metata TaxID=1033252 RepID=A0AAD7K1S2_9AGAR|nr:hypothetical protein B0H16DRAFT_1510493 [Mycena metata]